MKKKTNSVTSNKETFQPIELELVIELPISYHKKEKELGIVDYNIDYNVNHEIFNMK